MDTKEKLMDTVLKDKMLSPPEREEVIGEIKYLELSESSPAPRIEIVRQLVRPVVTLLLVLAFITALFAGYSTGELFGLNLISLGFWFGDRAAQNLIKTRKQVGPNKPEQ